MASEGLSTLIIGSIGPNISSCMIGSVGLMSIKIVGPMNLSDGSVSPPTAIFPLFRKDTSRLEDVQEIQDDWKVTQPISYVMFPCYFFKFYQFFHNIVTYTFIKYAEKDLFVSFLSLTFTVWWKRSWVINSSLLLDLCTNYTNGGWVVASYMFCTEIRDVDTKN